MKWNELLRAAQAVVDKEDGSMSQLKELVRGFYTPRVEFHRDSNALDITEEQIREFISARDCLEMDMGNEAFHNRRGNGTKIWVQGLLEGLPYLQGQHVYDDDDNFEGLDLVSSDEPGTWVAYRIEEIRINVYGKGFRVVDVRMLISPIHDSHARFGPAMYECWCRIEA